MKWQTWLFWCKTIKCELVQFVTISSILAPLSHCFSYKWPNRNLEAHRNFLYNKHYESSQKLLKIKD